MSPIGAPGIGGAPCEQGGGFVEDVLRRVQLCSTLEVCPKVCRAEMMLIRDDLLGQKGSGVDEEFSQDP